MRQAACELVGDQIAEIVPAADPSSPRRAPELEPDPAWRGSMTDEEWLASNGLIGDQEWAARIEADCGLDVRPFFGATPAGIVGEVPRRRFVGFAGSG